MDNKNKNVDINSILNSEINTKNNDNKIGYGFASSTPWKIWSIIFCFVNTLFIVYSAIEENYLTEGRTFGIDIIRAPYILYDCLIYLSLFLMNFLSMKNSHKLCKIFNKLHAFLSTTKIEINKYWFADLCWVAPYLDLFAVIGILAAVWVIQFPLFRSIYHICFYQFITAVSILLVSIYSSIFLGVLNSVGSLYKVVFSDIFIYSKNIEEKYCNSPLEVCCDRREEEAFTNAFVKRSNCWEENEISLKVQKTDNISSEEITVKSIRKCKVSLLQLSSYKRLIVDYFQVLIIIFMIKLISSTIIPLFFMNIMNPSEAIIPICHAAPCIISLLCLLNAPYKMNETVCLLIIIQY